MRTFFEYGDLGQSTMHVTVLQLHNELRMLETYGLSELRQDEQLNLHGWRMVVSTMNFDVNPETGTDVLSTVKTVYERGNPWYNAAKHIFMALFPGVSFSEADMLVNGDTINVHYMEMNVITFTVRTPIYANIRMRISVGTYVDFSTYVDDIQNKLDDIRRVIENIQADLDELSESTRSKK